MLVKTLSQFSINFSLIFVLNESKLVCSAFVYEPLHLYGSFCNNSVLFCRQALGLVETVV